MEFQSDILEGVFSVLELEDGKNAFFVKPEGTDKPDDVWALLSGYEGQEVTLAFHYVPTVGHPGWGGGSCKWQDVGWCPAGHHQDPDRILNVQGSGTLLKGPQQWDWSLKAFDGSVSPLPFHLLSGHYGRIAIATQFDIQKMRAALSKQGFDPDQVEALGIKANDLKEILSSMKKVEDDG